MNLSPPTLEPGVEVHQCASSIKTSSDEAFAMVGSVVVILFVATC